MPRISSWQEVERRLANLSKTTKVNNTTITKTNNSLNAFLSSLVLNLKDLLESQSEISLWFFNEDVPNTTNKPYIEWEDISQHYGDIFYSQSKGTIYQFTTSDKWELLNDETLKKAMALTNETIEDNERKVFTTEPTIPYQSGDWYIQTDGSLYICQIGRETGNYNESDFVSSVDYAGAIAEQTGNTLDVLKGTVITTSENAVTYLDKATNTTTEISGDSIKSGLITSNNYAKNNVGMQINLNEGLIDTKNFKLDKEGNVNLFNGAKVISDKGMLTNLQFQGSALCGAQAWQNNDAVGALGISFDIVIPDNFTITKAIIEFVHQPIRWTVITGWEDKLTPIEENVWGYTRDLTIYKDTLQGISEWGWQSDFGYDDDKFEKQSGITWTNLNGRSKGKICKDTWKAEEPTDTEYGLEVVVSDDIKDLLNLTQNSAIRVELRPVYLPPFSATSNKEFAEITANVSATINIYGYSNF